MVRYYISDQNRVKEWSRRTNLKIRMQKYFAWYDVRTERQWEGKKARGHLKIYENVEIIK